MNKIISNFLMCLIVVLLLTASPIASAQTQPTPAQPAPQSTGLKLIDTARGFEFTAPSELWNINAGKFSIGLNHNAVLDAVVTLKKSWYDVTTAQEAYEKRKNNLSSYLPGAIFIMENQRVLLPGNIEALSMTYKNPSDLKVSREIMFVHRGAAYEFVFQAKEENFTTVKEDFRYILENMKLY